jgi:hypothetical protein
MKHNRERLLEGDYYYSASEQDLGAPDIDATAGNPYKGLMGSPWYEPKYDPYNTVIPSSLEWYYIGFDELMKGDPDVVGSEAAFDWTSLENRLNDSASRSMHAVFTVMCHYLGDPLHIPQYLLDAGLTLLYYDGGVSPDYGDPILLKALEQFIEAFGARYDGDMRIAFIHLGLLGFWVRALEQSNSVPMSGVTNYSHRRYPFAGRVANLSQ